ncbi:MAG: hypothetical protein ACI8XB_000330 [Patiriisocius sp.]|jgi:hypothetical protein
MSLINKQHREMIVKYHQGKLSDAEMHQLEMDASNDPFLSDALDGFELDINQFGHDQLLKEVVIKMRPKPFYNSFIAPGIMLVTALYFLSPLVQDDNKSFPNHDLHTSSEMSISRGIEPERDVHLEEKEEVQLNKAVTLPKNLWLENTSPEEISNQAMEPQVENYIDPVQTKTIKSITAVIPDQNIKENEHPVYYLFNFKVANYKNYRSGVLFEQSLLNSVSAQYENNDSAQFTETDTKKILYTEFLIDCMRDFKNEKLKKAIRGYNTILRHYPNDANALFYGGLAYYNIGLTKKSVSFLQQSREHSFNVFNEESDWFLAMAYLKQGEKSKCMMILNDLIDTPHFYASKAKSTLKEFD